MAAILMTLLLGPDAELRVANWFKLLHMSQSYFGIGHQNRHKIYTGCSFDIDYIILVQFRLLSGHLLVKAAHSVDHMFPLYFDYF